jgi:hypothetical protein
MKKLHNTLKLTVASAAFFGLLSGANVATAVTLKADKFVAGGVGSNGKVIVKKSNGVTNIKLKGRSGTIQNAFGGHGTVKAWAQIDANGTIDSCWRCNKSAAETRKLGTGIYEVDFTPLSSDITSRPRLATIDAHDGLFAPSNIIVVVTRSGDPSSVFVSLISRLGAASDAPFTLLIF